MPQTITLNVNNQDRAIEVAPDGMLLYALRDNLGLHGPKFGCGLAECGACTCSMDGAAIRSCITPVSAVGNAKIVTVEAGDRRESAPRCRKPSSTNKPPSAATASMA